MPEFTASDGATVVFDDWGDPEAPPVVLLHGFTSDSRLWQPHIEAFTADYRVISPDLRGHGRSSAPENLESYTMVRYSEDLRELLDHIGADLCALAGCGFGGMVAADFAVRWPERVAALVLSDTSPASSHPDFDDAFADHESTIAGSEELVRKFGTAVLGKRASAGIRDEFLAEGMRTRYARLTREGYLGAAKARRERPDLLPLLAGQLMMPVLICIGEDDPVKSASEVMASRLPGARVIEFTETGHGVPAIRPEAWGTAVLEFLADVEEGRPLAGRLRI